MPSCFRLLFLFSFLFGAPLFANETFWNLVKRAPKTPSDSPEWLAVEHAFYQDPVVDLSYRKSPVSPRIVALLKHNPKLRLRIIGAQKTCFMVADALKKPDSVFLWSDLEEGLAIYPRLLDYKPYGHVKVRTLLRIFHPQSKLLAEAKTCELWDALVKAILSKEEFRFGEFNAIAAKLPHLLAYRPDADSESIIEIAELYNPLYFEALTAPEPFRQEYRGLGEIGRGAFGIVSLALHRHTSELVAIKAIKAEVGEDFGIPPREIALMERLGNHAHPNVVKLLHAIVLPRVAYLAMDYVQGERLHDYVSRFAPLPEVECRLVMRQVAAGVSFLHANGICHRDLTLLNILVDPEKRVKLIDVGLGNFLEPRLKLMTQCGTPHFRAPELAVREVVAYEGPAVDVWSMGVILFVLAARAHPFAHMSDILEIGYRWPEGLQVAAGVVALVSRILQPAEKRITLEQLQKELDGNENG